MAIAKPIEKHINEWRALFLHDGVEAVRARLDATCYTRTRIDEKDIADTVWWAVVCGHTDLFIVLYPHARQQKDPKHVFAQACEYGRLDIFEWLWPLVGSEDIRCNRHQALRKAARNGHLDIVARLRSCAHEADVREAAMSAAIGGQWDTWRALCPHPTVVDIDKAARLATTHSNKDFLLQLFGQLDEVCTTGLALLQKHNINISSTKSDAVLTTAFGGARHDAAFAEFFHDVFAHNKISGLSSFVKELHNSGRVRLRLLNATLQQIVSMGDAAMAACVLEWAQTHTDWIKSKASPHERSWEEGVALCFKTVFQRHSREAKKRAALLAVLAPHCPRDKALALAQQVHLLSARIKSEDIAQEVCNAYAYVLARQQQAALQEAVGQPTQISKNARKM